MKTKKIIQQQVIFNEEFWKNFDQHLDIMLDKKIDEKGLITLKNINHLPTKEEFYAKEDELLSELKTVREEITTLSGLHQKINSHEDRIEKLEKFTKIKTL
ncbi:MAG TPA: hypothetical protein VG895_01555 [Patescibacteria group bacterium]|nr:hypothetical protein [Patescibacteria group bacterium]